MDCLCAIFETGKLVWGVTGGYCINFINLDQNMGKLIEDTEYLRSQGKDKKDKLCAEEWAGKKAKQEVLTWLGNVDRTEKEVKRFEEDVKGSNCVKRVWLARQVQGWIDKVAEVNEKGKFPDGFVIDASPPKGMLIPMEDFFSKATSARNCEKVRKCLTTHKFKKIGVVGMGGAGKTMIMKQIHNEMIERTANYFDEVIWVTVSKVGEGSIIEKIQDSVAKHLYPKKDDFQNNWKPKDEMERTRVLCTKFSEKRYLLLLDDVWETIPLDKVGVSSSSKVTLILTTRLKEVSEKMDCETVEIDLLTEQEAKDLFMGTIALDVNKLTPEMKGIIETIAKKCARLPLAIMIISRNMRKEKDIDAWREQLDQISRKEIKDKYADVLEVLRFSYDRLENEKLKLKECFLYCTLYPEDHDIPRKELIEYWIMERLIDEMNSREAMIDKGDRILNKLIDTNLLERTQILTRDGINQEECVRAHDLIREMSLQIIGTRFASYSGDRLLNEVPSEIWSQDREKIFLTDNRIRVLPSSPRCSRLTTFVLRENSFLDSIPDDIFSNMPLLKVLDLSYMSIQSLPKSISNLENLHALLASHCRHLKDVPSLAKLQKLKELIMCCNEIAEVPDGLEKLVNLRNLDLFAAKKLESFDSWKLRGLSKLQRLRIDFSKVKVSAEDLLCLEKLEVVGAEFQNGLELIRYLNSRQRQLQKYHLYAESDFHSDWYYFEDIGKEVRVDVFEFGTVVGRLVIPSNIESLDIGGYNFRGDIIPWKNTKNLRKLALFRCDGLQFIFRTPSSSSSENCQTPLESVEEFFLSELSDLRLIFHELAPPGGFSFKLKKLNIFNCSGIKNIFPAMLLKNFPNLEEINVGRCENVKEIIVDGAVEMTITLPNLNKIYLFHLPALESIHKGTMVTRSLDEIQVWNCPKLKRLPFSCLQTDDGQQQASPAPALRYVEANEEWWESLEWDDDHIKTTFQRSFWRK